MLALKVHTKLWQSDESNFILASTKRLSVRLLLSIIEARVRSTSGFSGSTGINDNKASWHSSGVNISGRITASMHYSLHRSLFRNGREWNLKICSDEHAQGVSFSFRQGLSWEAAKLGGRTFVGVLQASKLIINVNYCPIIFKSGSSSWKPKSKTCKGSRLRN